MQYETRITIKIEDIERSDSGRVLRKYNYDKAVACEDTRILAVQSAIEFLELTLIELAKGNPSSDPLV